MTLLILALLSVGFSLALAAIGIRAPAGVPLASLTAISAFELFVWLTEPADKFVAIAWVFGGLYCLAVALATYGVIFGFQRFQEKNRARRTEVTR